MAGGRREIVLTPIEVAIDEMQTKVSSLREVINNPIPDAKKLQLNLQGCVSSQVRPIGLRQLAGASCRAASARRYVP